MEDGKHRYGHTGATKIQLTLSRACVLATVVTAMLLSIVVLEPAVRSDAEAQQAPGDTYIIVFDVSGSMRRASEADPSRSRLQLAKDGLTSAISSLQPNSANIGLRSFSGCGTSRTSLLVPPQPNDPAVLNAAINGLSASGSTGIETALRAAVSDLPASPTGENIILLVSDGVESCGGDPCAAAADIVAQGTQVVVNTVGFQTAGTAAEPQLECIANATGGTSIAVVQEQELFDVVVGTIERCTVALEICYAPELRFHPQETHFPTNPTDFVRQSELRWAADDSCGEVDIATQAEVTSANLTNHWWFEMGGRGKLFFTGCDPTSIGPFSSQQVTAPRKGANDGTARARGQNNVTLATDEGFYLNHTVGDTNNSPVNKVVSAPTFYFTVDVNGLREIHYWFFYHFDPKANAVDAVFAHEGDWEHIAVELDASDELQRVRYYGHGCDPIVRDRAEVQFTQGTHPIVYPAKGSHASYPAPRTSDLEFIPGTNVPDFRAINTWPEDCSNGLSGITDDAVFDSNVSGVLQTWNELRFPANEAWYGFGGLWGNNGFRAERSGPVGLPYSSEFGKQIAATGGRLTPAPGNLQIPNKQLFQWLEPGRFTFLDGLPGRNFIVVLESLPTVVGTGSYDGSGNAQGEFIVPASTPPGLHRVVIRDANTGEVLGSYPIAVDIPAECRVSPAVPDIDGDGLIDSCDNRPDDGPLADFDGDGVLNQSDNCPTVSNSDQTVEGERTIGNACNSVLGVNPNPSFPIITASVLPPGPVASVTPDPATPVPTTPAVLPTTAPEPPEELGPVTNVPPDQNGALGFGAPGPIVAATVVPPVPPVAPPLAVPISIPEPSATDPDPGTSVIAVTGAEHKTLVPVGTLLIGLGLLALAYRRVLDEING